MSEEKRIKNCKKEVDVFKNVVRLSFNNRLNNYRQKSTKNLEQYLKTLPIDTLLDIVALEYFAVSKEVNDGQTIEEAFEEERKCFEHYEWQDKVRIIDKISEKSNLDKHLMESLMMLKLI